MENVTNENEIREVLSVNIAFFLKKLGMTQADLARAMFPEAMSSDSTTLHASKRNAISRWANGIRTPSAAECLNLAEIFGCTISDLVTVKQKKRRRKAAKTG